MADAAPKAAPAPYHSLPLPVGNRPSWSSPQGLYDFIMSKVPGLSPGQASWMQAEILGGKPFLQDAHVFGGGGGVHMVGSPSGPPGPADSVPAGYFTSAQLAAIMGLQPFAAGASEHTGPVGVQWHPSSGTGGTSLTTQPTGVGDWHPPASFLGGGYHLPTYEQLGMPGNPYPSDASGNVPRPPYAPPPEDSGSPPPGRTLTHPLVGNFDSTYGAGAHLAESALGLGLPSVSGSNYLDMPTVGAHVSPIHYLHRRSAY